MSLSKSSFLHSSTARPGAFLLLLAAVSVGCGTVTPTKTDGGSAGSGVGGRAPRIAGPRRPARARPRVKSGGTAYAASRGREIASSDPRRRLGRAGRGGRMWRPSPEGQETASASGGHDGGWDSASTCSGLAETTCSSTPTGCTAQNCTNVRPDDSSPRAIARAICRRSASRRLARLHRPLATAWTKLRAMRGAIVGRRTVHTCGAGTGFAGCLTPTEPLR